MIYDKEQAENVDRTTKSQKEHTTDMMVNCIFIRIHQCLMASNCLTIVTGQEACVIT